MSIRGLLSFVISVAVIFAWGVAQADESKEIFVSDAWVQAMPPSQKTTAAYMTIANNSTKEVVLVSASSDIAGAAELHQMSESNGMMNMNQVTGIHIPALGKVSLKQGGYHIMLIGLNKPVNKGDTVVLILHFQDGTNITVDVPVKPQAAENPSSASQTMAGMKM